MANRKKNLPPQDREQAQEFVRLERMGAQAPYESLVRKAQIFFGLNLPYVDLMRLGKIPAAHS